MSGTQKSCDSGVGPRHDLVLKFPHVVCVGSQGANDYISSTVQFSQMMQSPEGPTL